MSDNNKSVAVIGAGIVGVSCALWLQRKGFEVVLLDRDGVAEGTSMGNAGILETSGIIPVTAPGILFQAPRMLFHPNEPLFLRWSYLPKMIPFLFRYLSQATQEKLERFAKNMTPLIYDSY